MDQPARQPGWFVEMLDRYPRLAIAGGPGTGKTSLAGTVSDRPVFGTDALIALPWDEVPGAVIAQSQQLGERWVIEGVQVARALRKGLQPDAVVMLSRPHRPQGTAQAGMAKGIEGIMSGIALRLALMGIPIIRR